MKSASIVFIEYVQHCRKTGFPECARAMAGDAFPDCLGCMVAGAGEPIAGMLENIIFYATDRPETSAAPMAVSGRRVSPPPPPRPLYQRPYAG